MFLSYGIFSRKCQRSGASQNIQVQLAVQGTPSLQNSYMQSFTELWGVLKCFINFKKRFEKVAFSDFWPQPGHLAPMCDGPARRGGEGEGWSAVEERSADRSDMHSRLWDRLINLGASLDTFFDSSFSIRNIRNNRTKKHTYRNVLRFSGRYVVALAVPTSVRFRFVEYTLCGMIHVKLFDES